MITNISSFTLFQHICVPLTKAIHGDGATDVEAMHLRWFTIAILYRHLAEFRSRRGEVIYQVCCLVTITDQGSFHVMGVEINNKSSMLPGDCHRGPVLIKNSKNTTQLLRYSLSIKNPSCALIVKLAQHGFRWSA